MKVGKRLLKVLSILTALAVCVWISPGAALSANTDDENSSDVAILNSDFEDGTTQGWVTCGEGKVEAVKDVAHGGSYSLVYTERKQNYNCPSYDLTGKVKPGDVLTATAYVYYKDEDAASKQFNFTAEHAEGGDNSYTQFSGCYGVPANKGTWTKISGTYTVPVGLTHLRIYLEYTDSKDLGDIYIDDITVTAKRSVPKPVQEDIPSLYEQFNIPIGAAVEPEQINDPLHAKLLVKHFNSIVAENCMKWDTIEPAEGQFNFTKADQLIDFAIEHNIKVRFHNLCWYQQCPEWVFEHADGTPLDPNSEEDKQLLYNRLKNHITTVMRHFIDKYGSSNPIYAWDVVNEAINDDGSYRESNWYQILGPEYIEDAFKIARSVDPSAKLFYNDYSLETPSKGDGVYNLVKKLKQENLIDGLGNQAHIGVNEPTVEAMKNVIERFAALGVEVQITELDMTTAGASDENTLNLQGQRYKELFEMFREEANAGKLTSITFWGIADDHTWLNDGNDFPLLFDRELQAKPAYWGIVDPSKLTPYIQGATIFNGTPKLEDASDQLWQISNSNAVKNVVKGVGAPAMFKAVWDSSYLYVLASVKDSTPNANDNIEIFVDRNNSKQDSYDGGVSHYTIYYDGKNSNGLKTVSSKTSDGYTLGVQIPIDSASPEKGATIGFDMRVNDYASDASQSADNVSIWNDTKNSVDTSTAYFGNLMLGGQAKVTEAGRGTPVIDGKMDGIWSNSNIITTSTQVVGTPLGATAKVRTLWDDDYLYVLAEVADSNLDKSSPNAYEQDSVETFIDENNAKSIDYQSDDCQYRVNFNNETSFNGACDQERFKSATSVTPNGYIVEEAIPIEHVKAEAGRIIGFDVQVNDGTNGSRTGISIWCDPSGNSYKNTSGFGNLKMVEKAEPVNPSALVEYRSHVQRLSWQPFVSDGELSGTTHKALRDEAIQIKLTPNAPAGASITYQAYVQKYGWLKPVSNGQTAGTTGRKLRMEAFRVTINGMPGYQVKYRAYIQGSGWQGYKTTPNGTAITAAAVAGTTGKAKRIEAIEIKIEKAPPTSVPVYLYHVVKENLDGTYQHSLTEFKKEMEYLHNNGYTTLSINDFYNIISGNSPAPSKPVLLTFDDASSDFYTNVFPILKKYNLKATLFVVPAWLDTDGFMTKAQLAEVAKYSNLDIENHTYDHGYFTSMTADKQKAEITDAAAAIKEITGRTTTFIAYPFGDFNDTTISILKSLGYKGGFTVNSGFATTETGKFLLPRNMMLQNHTFDNFLNVLKNGMA